MKRSLLALAVVLIALTTLADAPPRRRAAPPPTEEGLTFQNWIARRAIPFATTDPIGDDRDLIPLLSIIGDKTYVGVGEATHGSHEFFAMKDRLFRFLVERMGFTVFSIEASLPECDDINAYVHGGDGNAGLLVANMHFWTWNVDEVVNLVEWMRTYNLAHPDKPQLSFRGFDMQFSEQAVATVDAYVARVDPANASKVDADLRCMAVSYGAYQLLPLTTRNACRDTVVAAYNIVANSRDAYTTASSAAEYERMLRYARLAVQFEDTAGHQNGLTRDSYMAENAIWIGEVEHPGEKMMMWAHNYHISRGSGARMGAFLRTHWRTSHLNFGVVFDHGDFNARDIVTTVLEKKHVDAANDNGWDTFFRATHMPRFILDLRNPPDSASFELFRPHMMWDIGAAFPVARETNILADQWDVILWIAESTPSRLR